ncbi:TIM barrel protein [Candidatus Poribacteria bacterium]
MLEYTTHVHLRNAVVGNFQAAMDEGIMDFDWVLNTLKAHGYDGYISVEYIDGREDYNLKEQIVKLRKLIEAA